MCPLPAVQNSDYNVPAVTNANMSAGQGLIYADLFTAATPEGYPSTDVGGIKNLKISLESEVLDFNQGFPQTLMNRLKKADNAKLMFDGYEPKNMDLNQLRVGNTAVDTTQVGIAQRWGLGGNASMLFSKALVYHRFPNKDYCWIHIWKMLGDGNFNWDFNDEEWHNQSFVFDMVKGTADFAGVALTDHFLCRIDVYTATP